MQKRTMIMAGLAAGILAALAGCKNEAPTAKEQAAEALMPIGVVQIVQHQALDEASRGIVDGLAERGYKDGVNIKLDIQNAQGDQSNLHNIVNRFISDKSRVIFAVATPAAQSAASATKTIPIVATAVTNFEIAKLAKSNEHPGGNVTGVSDINPVADQLKLLLELDPNVKAVAALYNSSEVNSEFQVGLLKKAAAELGVEVVDATVTNVNEIPQVVRNVVGRVQGIYVPTDNVIASALPAVMKVAVPAHLPVIAGEGEPVRGGALASIGVDYYELGKMTGRMGADILDGKAKPADMPIQSQVSDKVIVNMKTARAIGMTIPESVMKRAEKVGE